MLSQEPTYYHVATFTKSYHDALGINIAAQVANTEWSTRGGKNVGESRLWQNDWIILGGRFYNEENYWDYFNANSGQSFESVNFITQVPIPWGTITVNNLQSTVNTFVYPNSASAF